MILLKMFFLQIGIAAVVLFILWILLEKELIMLAIENLERVNSQEAFGVGEVTILATRGLPPNLERSLCQAVQARFSEARINLVRNQKIWGGVVIQAGPILIDASLSGKLKRMWGGGNK